ncbi:MAG: sulfide/dihydroorotate dehydrogenase-like FAD/NAD-binding protein [Bacteroidales bacterium]|nr:sulfide/dihydroorotate dehydrogenase-like FAD/NAD-binding protein [Bacteroidales bacterium]
MFRILSKNMLSAAVCEMEVEAGRVARAALPGQFLIVRAGPEGERVPLTISDCDADRGTVTIVTQKVGASTTDIVAMEAGDCFEDVVGPLGLPSEFVKSTPEELRDERYVFIAGGVGAAPVYPQVKWLADRGVSVDVIVAARTADLLIYTEKLAMPGVSVHVCTDDGSRGFKGVGTAMLEKLVADGARFTRAVAIGPMIMMKFTALCCRKLDLPVTVSLNTLMVDGTGMCGACRVTVGGKTRFACVEGPEFDGWEVDFDEAMNRQGQYREEERAAMENHVCKIGRG